MPVLRFFLQIVILEERTDDVIARIAPVIDVDLRFFVSHTSKGPPGGGGGGGGRPTCERSESRFTRCSIDPLFVTSSTPRRHDVHDNRKFSVPIILI